MSIRPSSLPALAHCPCFTNDGAPISEHAQKGTARHKLWKQFFDGDQAVIEATDHELRERLLWAVEQVRLLAPMSDYPLDWERRRSFIAPEFSVITGTPDVTCGPVVLDLKWRWGEYVQQMAAYALMLIEDGHAEVTVYVLFAEPCKVVKYTFTRESAEAVIAPILEAAANPDRRPTMCEYCDWCGAQLTCPAKIAAVNAVVAGREDWQLSTFHPSQITHPDEMGKCLRIARALADWCESAEYHARNMALKLGMVPTGFETATKQGRREITDLAAAFDLSKLPQAEFLKACKVGWGDLAKIYAAANGLPKAAAERGLETLLGDVVKRGAPTVSLVETKKK